MRRGRSSNSIFFESQCCGESFSTHDSSNNNSNFSSRDENASGPLLRDDNGHGTAVQSMPALLPLDTAAAATVPFRQQTVSTLPSLPSSQHGVRSIQPHILQRAVDLWNAASAPATYVAAAVAVRGDVKEQLLRGDAMLLLNAIRKLSHAYKRQPSQNIKNTGTDSGGTVADAFATLVRFATRDLRVLVAAAPVLRPIPLPHDEAEFYVAVVSNRALQHAASSSSSSFFPPSNDNNSDSGLASASPLQQLAQRAVIDPAVAVLDALQARIISAHALSEHGRGGHPASKPKSGNEALLQAALLLERVLSRCLDHLERHVVNYFDSQAPPPPPPAASADISNKPPCVGAFERQARMLLNPHRIAAAAQLRLFELLMLGIVSPHPSSSSAASHPPSIQQHPRIRQWLARNTPLLAPSDNHGSGGGGASSTAPPPGLRRFRLLSAKADPQLARRLAACWSAVAAGR